MCRLYFETRPFEQPFHNPIEGAVFFPYVRFHFSGKCGDHFCTGGFDPLIQPAFIIIHVEGKHDIEQIELAAGLADLR